MTSCLSPRARRQLKDGLFVEFVDTVRLLKDCTGECFVKLTALSNKRFRQIRFQHSKSLQAALEDAALTPANAFKYATLALFNSQCQAVVSEASMLPQPVLADIVQLLKRRSAPEDESSDDEDEDEDGDKATLSRLRMLHAHLKHDEEESDEEDSSETELGPHTKEELVALIKDSF